MSEARDGRADVGGVPLSTLAAVASGVGVVGFVVLVGGAIVWARYQRIGVPPDQAVYEIPKFQLVTIGIIPLVAFALFAALVIAWLYARDPTGSSGPRSARRLTAVALVEVAIAVGFGLSLAAIAALAAVAAVLVVVNLVVAKASGDRFLVFGVAIFVGIALYGGLLAYLRNLGDPQLQPMVVLLKTGKVLEGIYVADNQDHVLIAHLPYLVDGAGRAICDASHRVQRDSRRAELLEIDRADVASLQIGRLQQVESMYAQIPLMRGRLLADSPLKDPPPKTKPPDDEVCKIHADRPPPPATPDPGG
jgi:hypothetical protein